MKKHRKVEARKRVSELQAQLQTTQNSHQHKALHLHLEALEKEFSVYSQHENKTDKPSRELATS